MLLRALFITITVAMAAMATPAATAAEGPTYLTGLQVRVHPGMAPKYNQLIRRLIEAHDKLETDFYWNAATVQYGPGGMYTFGRWHTSTATLQANPRNVMAEAFGEDAAREWAAGIAETTAETQSGMWTMRPDLSVMPPEDMQPKNLGMLRVVVKPFANGAYESYLLKSAEATRAIEPTGYYVTYAPMWGAENAYVFVTLLPDLGELGPPPASVPERLLKHFGEREGRRLLETRTGLIESQGFTLANVRPDLSRPAPE